MANVLLIGEPLYCIHADAGGFDDARSFSGAVGGAETNVAVGLARLGVPAAMVGAVGADEVGLGIIRHLQAEGVATRDVHLDATAPTGIVLARPSTDADPVISYRRDGTAAARHRVPLDRVTELARSARHVHVTGITFAVSPGLAAAALDIIRSGRRTGMTVTFDPNFRDALMTANDLRHLVELFAHPGTDLLLNDHEAELITGAQDPSVAVSMLCTAGFGRVVVRHGAHGSHGYEGSRVVHQPAIPATRVVDTIGAGDAYTAGYLSEIVHGHSLERAMRTGSWAASRVVEVRGDHTGAPTAGDYANWRREDAA